MKIISRAAVVTTAALVSLSALVAAQPAPATSGTIRVQECRKPPAGSGCTPAIVLHTWAAPGGKVGVGWIYASTESPRRTHDLRWLVQTPGGKLTAKSGWAKGRRTGGTHVETYWGKDGRTGPRYPRKTRVCVQVRGGKPLCLRLSR